MVRPKIMDDGKILSVVLDTVDREIIEKERGDRSCSSYIRSIIREQDPKASQQGEAKTLVLRKELRAMEAELESYRRNEQEATKEQEEVMKYIAQGFELYTEKNKRAGDPEARRNWLEARCKGSGVSPAEFLSYQKKI